MDSRYYPGVEIDVHKLLDELRNLFDDDYEVQTMQVAATSVLQARKSSTLRDLTGLSAALTIKITPEGGGTASRSGCRSGLTKLRWPRWRSCFLQDCCSRFRRSVPTGNTRSPKMPGEL